MCVVFACVCVCNLSSKREVASTNLIMSGACPELKPLASTMDVHPIKLAGQVLRMISINCINDKIASKVWIIWYLAVCTKV